MKKASWLSDNIRSIQSLLWSCATITVLVMILTKSTMVDEKILYLILGSLFGLCMNQQGYYFTASKSQTDAAKAQTDNVDISKV